MSEIEGGREAPRHLIFVYGTLMEGEGNWSWALAPEPPLFLAKTLPGQFELCHLGGFPGMVPRDSAPEDHQVSGEVFLITDEQLQQIDRLEGHPNFYRREEIEVEPEDYPRYTEGPIKVSTYVYQGRHHGNGRIASGSWRSRRAA